MEAGLHNDGRSCIAELSIQSFGNYKNKGQKWHKKGEATKVNRYDFPNPQVPHAYPYGVYDLKRNEGFVNVGSDHDTFAVASIWAWWTQVGQKVYAEVIFNDIEPCAVQGDTLLRIAVGASLLAIFLFVLRSNMISKFRVGYVGNDSVLFFSEKKNFADEFARLNHTVSEYKFLVVKFR